jgi:DNA-binding CsgD family transcriptional regulator
MKNSPLIQIVPHVVALSTGFITICCTIFLYVRHRKKVYLYFSLLSFSMLSKLLNVIVKLYFMYFPPANEYLVIFFKIIKNIGFSLFILVLPLFINHIMKLKLNLFKHIIFILTTLIVLFLNSSQYLIRLEFDYSYIITNIIFISVLAYSIGMVILNFKNISDEKLKKIILTFLVLAIIFFPLGIFDIVIGETSIQLPIYFFIINILSIIFCFYYLYPPLNITDDKLSEFIQKKYKITKREKEIISLVKKGYSNSEISKITLISISTVEKHIYSIYKKFNINNRVQLINFLQSGLK